MRDAGIIAVIIIAAVSIGGLLYLYGGSAFHPTVIPTAQQTAHGEFTILAQGASAVAIDQRVNYRITDASQLSTLWQMVYSNNGPSEPVVDFSGQEVLAVFDGSHSAAGYGIRVNSVKDEDGQRVIDITHIEPGSTCTPTGGPSSPFAIISVNKSTLPLTHAEHTEIHECR